ncbi:MAG TPA: hypothetical protein ENI76_10785 [Ignavibacteria bacterium]|nr:hypothetical protein [Ignavibacteria bacterium]
MKKNIDPFNKILDEMKKLHMKKSADYGTDEDPYANIMEAEKMGIEAWEAVVIRMGDKLSRLQSLSLNQKLENESGEDSFLDLAVYGIIGLIMLRRLNDERLLPIEG